MIKMIGQVVFMSPIMSPKPKDMEELNEDGTIDVALSDILGTQYMSRIDVSCTYCRGTQYSGG
jgi:hypothetical protein